MHYFDHAASTNLDPDVLDALAKSFKNDFANPNAQHLLGRKLLDNIKNYAHFFKQTLNQNEGEFIFVGSATEANNIIINGIEISNDQSIVVSMGDHSSITAPAKLNEKNKKVYFLNAKEISNSALISSLKPALLVLTSVNGQNGEILEVNKIAAELKSELKNVHIHIDHVQGFGKIKFNFSKQIDSIALSAHKINGPKGIAGLYLKDAKKIRPLILGGGQQLGIRSGTEAYPLIHAFKIASELNLKNLERNFEHVLQCNLLFKKKLLESKIDFQFLFENTSPYIVSFILPKIPSDMIIRQLEMKEIYIASTSACSSKIKGHNPLFTALGIEEKWHKNVLRVSFSKTHTFSEVEFLAENLINTFNQLSFLVK